jgi:hypothetical protein
VDIQLTDAVVSARHAVFDYCSGGWHARDLGSRNGTWVRGKKLESGEWFQLREGDSLRFGKSAAPLIVHDLRPPPLLAIPERGHPRTARDGVIALPEEGEPEVLLMSSARGFVMEKAGKRTALSHGQMIECGGQMWRVELPSSAVMDTEQLEESLSLDQALAIFEVSSDEEHIRLVLKEAGRSLEFPSRSFCSPLMFLAEARLLDERAGIAGAECGWRSRHSLLESLRVSPEKLNLDLHRARRALLAKGVRDVNRLIERRLEAGLLRIGILRISVERPGDSGEMAIVKTPTKRPSTEE